MKIYFNWLGEWLEIDDKDDYIEDMRPSDFITGNIPTYICEESLDHSRIIPIFIRISKKNIDYTTPITQLVWSEKKSNFTNEEKW